MRLSLEQDRKSIRSSCYLLVLLSFACSISPAAAETSNSRNDACKTVVERMKLALRVAGDSFVDAITIRGIVTLSSELQSAFEDDSFFESLEECYGDDTFSRNMLLNGLAIYESIGKVAGVSTLLGGQRLLNWGCKRVLSPLKEKSSKLYWGTRIGIHSATWGPMLFFGYSGYRDYKDQTQRAARFRSLFPGINSIEKEQEGGTLSPEQAGDKLIEEARRQSIEWTVLSKLALLDTMTESESKIRSQLGTTNQLGVLITHENVDSRIQSLLAIKAFMIRELLSIKPRITELPEPLQNLALQRISSLELELQSLPPPKDPASLRGNLP